MKPTSSSLAPTPRYGSVGHIVDNSLPSQLQYIDLSYKVEDSSGAVQGEAKQILGGMTFEIQRGTMFAIMGPSGAGKTTLLGILGMRTMRGDLEYTRFTKVRVFVYIPTWKGLGRPLPCPTLHNGRRLCHRQSTTWLHCFFPT